MENLHKVNTIKIVMKKNVYLIYCETFFLVNYLFVMNFHSANKAQSQTEDFFLTEKAVYFCSLRLFLTLYKLLMWKINFLLYYVSVSTKRLVQKRLGRNLK